jgi:hypothetical protein
MNFKRVNLEGKMNGERFSAKMRKVSGVEAKSPLGETE